MSVAEHKAHSPPPAGVRVALVTASDSRSGSDDEGGRVLRACSESAGFAVVGATILREDEATLRAHVAALAASGTVDAVLVTGGTGLAPRDRTPEALEPLYERRIEGFGELFRALSFAEIGPAAMLSRASAGVVGGTLVFTLPGSPAAVRLAMERLVAPELAHAVGQLRRPAREESHGHRPRT
jgi:molybdenum cofactor biosynthesis protein B